MTMNEIEPATSVTCGYMLSDIGSCYDMVILHQLRLLLMVASQSTIDHESMTLTEPAPNPVLPFYNSSSNTYSYLEASSTEACPMGHSLIL
jgi:hypothetical protein